MNLTHPLLTCFFNGSASVELLPTSVLTKLVQDSEDPINPTPLIMSYSETFLFESLEFNRPSEFWKCAGLTVALRLLPNNTAGFFSLGRFPRGTCSLLLNPGCLNDSIIVLNCSNSWSYNIYIYIYMFSDIPVQSLRTFLSDVSDNFWSLSVMFIKLSSKADAIWAWKEKDNQDRPQSNIHRNNMRRAITKRYIMMDHSVLIIGRT